MASAKLYYCNRWATIAVIAGVLAVVLSTPTRAEEAECNIIPAPRQLELREGTLTLTPTSRIVATSPELKPVAAVLATEMRQLFSLPLDVSRTAIGDGDIVLEIDTKLTGEGYRVEVGDRVSIRAANVGAVAQATVTFLQSLHQNDRGIAIRRMTVSDEPAVAYRGLMIDCARGPHSISTLQQMIILCHWYKIRYLHLHLTDDQAFTFPSKALPELNARCHHYALKDLKALNAFAKHRGVTLIPELDVPGHAMCFVQPMPKLFGTIPTPAAQAPSQAICVGREEVYQALDTLVGEMCSVFRDSPYFHIGGDEVDYRYWQQCPDTQRYMASHQIENMDELYRHFLVRMDAIVKKHGKKTLVWEGFAKDGRIEIPKDVTVMAFESKYNLPHDLLAGGYKVINAAWQPLYITPGKRWPPEHIYGWNHFRWESCWPVSAAFKTPIVVPPTPDVLGAQMCAWEQGENAELPSLRDRLPAMSERIWNPNAGLSFRDFSRRFKQTDAGLDKLLKQK